jgi:hypothetical protein
MSLRTISLLLLGATGLVAQSTSTVTGQVVDVTGAAMPGAKVVVRAVETGVERRTESNSEGFYTVPSLPPVKYVVSAEADGFQKASSEEFKLDVSSAARVDLKLSPGNDREHRRDREGAAGANGERLGGNNGGRAGVQEHAAERAEHDRVGVHGSGRAGRPRRKQR